MTWRRGEERLTMREDVSHMRLGRWLFNIAVVVGGLLLFSQWYLPRCGQRLALDPSSPKFKTLRSIMYEERFKLRSELMDNPSEHTPGIIWDNGMRASRPKQYIRRPHRVLFVGDSWTFGVGVRDEDTYVWQLHQAKPDCLFDNAAVPGYGAYTSMLAMEEYLSQGFYDVVIYAGIYDHFYRDAFFRAERFGEGDREVFYKHPYCVLAAPASGADKPSLRYYPGGYVSWWGDDRLYLINFSKSVLLTLGNVWVRRLTERGQYGNFLCDERMAATRLRLILDDMNKVAERYNARFGFVALDAIYVAMQRARLLEDGEVSWKPPFPYLNVTYPRDFTRDRRLCTYPTRFDDGRHPGPPVQRYYCDRIAAWLRSEFSI